MPPTHGEARHGKRTKEWRAWYAMLCRCRYPSGIGYHLYGGRGIMICARWRNSYENFLEDMGRAPSPELQLDRIDNDGNYEPGNCRWVTAKRNSRNRRSARMITFCGVTKTLVEWSEEMGLNRKTITQRLDVCGWTVDRALSTPANGSD